MTTILEKALKYDLKNKEYHIIALKNEIETTLDTKITPITESAKTNYLILETTFTFQEKRYVLWLHTLKLLETSAYYIKTLEIECLED